MDLSLTFLTQKYMSYMSIIIQSPLHTLESVPLPTMHPREGVPSDEPVLDLGPCIDCCKYLHKKQN